jgi:low affinity Fe/Cu permease
MDFARDDPYRHAFSICLARKKYQCKHKVSCKEKTMAANIQNRRPHSPASELFHRFAAQTSAAAGSARAFVLAVICLLIWACSYPLFLNFPEPFNTWQLVVNTGTTIITFLMVFLIQNTQNRDARALHLKLDELIRAIEGARNRLVDLEDCTDEELAHLQEEFRRLRSQTKSA